jgi:hypothetical protein
VALKGLGAVGAVVASGLAYAGEWGWAVAAGLGSWKAWSDSGEPVYLESTARDLRAEVVDAARRHQCDLELLCEAMNEGILRNKDLNSVHQSAYFVRSWIMRERPQWSALTRLTQTSAVLAALSSITPVEQSLIDAWSDTAVNRQMITMERLVKAAQLPGGLSFPRK